MNKTAPDMPRRTAALCRQLLHGAVNGVLASPRRAAVVTVQASGTMFTTVPPLASRIPESVSGMVR